RRDRWSAAAGPSPGPAPVVRSGRSCALTLPPELAQDGLHSRDVLAHAAVLVRLRQAAGRLLHPQVELLAAELDELVGELLLGHFPELLGVHHITCRVTNSVGNGSFAAARRNASRATSSVTPSISYSIFPGCTRHTQYSTLPLPLPWRTSSGFLVTGLSGNTRIQILPPRLM